MRGSETRRDETRGGKGAGVWVLCSGHAAAVHGSERGTAANFGAILARCSGADLASHHRTGKGPGRSRGCLVKT